jgi:hypothetical protein
MPPPLTTTTPAADKLFLPSVLDWANGPSAHWTETKNQHTELYDEFKSSFN